MKSLLGRIGLVTTKYATAAALLGAAMSVGGAGMITRDGPDPGDGGGTGADPGHHVGNYCRDRVSNLGSQGGGELDRTHGTTVRPANDPRVVE